MCSPIKSDVVSRTSETSQFPLSYEGTISYFRCISNTEHYNITAFCLLHPDIGCRLPREPSLCLLLLLQVLPDLLERDGLVDLLVVVRVVLPGGQLKEGLSDELALIVPAPAHCLIHLEDGVAQVHAEVHALCFGLTLVIVH